MATIFLNCVIFTLTVHYLDHLKKAKKKNKNYSGEEYTDDHGALITSTGTWWIE